MTKSVKWLHLSDLHVGMKNQDFLWPRFEGQFLKDIETLFNKSGPWDLVVFSGDFVQTGSLEEYDRLDGILNLLWDKFSSLGCSPKLVSVPGNHDLVRPDAAMPEKVALDSYWSSQDVRTLIWKDSDSRYKPFINGLFANYSIWRDRLITSGRHLNPTDSGLMPGDSAYKLVTDQGSTSIVCLNSTWLQIGGGNYYEKLLVDPRQLMAVTQGSPQSFLQQSDFSLLITHQPVSWLHPQSLADWNNEINSPGLFDFHLYGHMHVPMITRSALGGSAQRQSLQSASLFGLEYLGDGKIDRIQGYTSNSIEINGSTKLYRCWPRTLTDIGGGLKKITPDISQDINEDNFLSFPIGASALHTSTGAAAPLNSGKGSVVTLNSTADIDIEQLKYHLVENSAHRTVRKIEQKLFNQELLEKRAVWLSSDWGMGEDGFLAAARFALGEHESPVFRFNFEDYKDRQGFLAGIRLQYGVSFQSICDVIAENKGSYLLFDEIPTGRSQDSGVKTVEFDVEELAQVVLDYDLTARVVLRARRSPSHLRFLPVHLSALDEADVALYLREAGSGGKRYSKPDVIGAIYRHTDGVPNRLDAALRQLEVGSLDDLGASNSDITTNAPSIVAVPESLILSVNELKESKDPNLRRAHDLLLALGTLPRGEQLGRMKRFYGPHPIHVTHASELLERSLIDTSAVTGLGDVDDANLAKTLVVPKPVREYIRDTLDPDISYGLDRKALVLYFGDDWKAGAIGASNIVKRTKNRLCNSNEIANASALIARNLHRATVNADNVEIEAAIRLGSAYVEALLSGDHYRSAVSLCDDLIPNIDIDEYPIEINTLMLERARALRMTSNTKAARDQFLALELNDLTKVQRQSALLGLALCYEQLSEGPIEQTAKRVIEIDRHSGSALHARVVIAAQIEDAGVKNVELGKLFAIAKKKGNHTLANTISLDMAYTSGEDIIKSGIRLREVISSAKNNDDFYNGARAAISLAARRDKSLNFPESDKIELIQVYHFLYNERMDSLFSQCHAALWDIFSSEDDTDNLLNLFRHSSFIWRINGRQYEEEKYLSKLLKKLHQVLSGQFSIANRDHAYFVIRVTVVLGDENISKLN